jgi:hypothetical protein
MGEAPQSPNQVDLRPILVPNLFDMMRDSTPSRLFDYVYVPLGKCANTDIKRMLWHYHHRAGYPLDVPADYFSVHNYGWRKSYGTDPSPWNCYVKNDYARLLSDLADGRVDLRFTFVRNPYARLLSGYMDKIVNSGETADIAAAAHKLPRAPNDFADFVHIVVEQKDEDRDIHWSTQVYRLAFEFFDYNFVGTVELLNAGKAYLRKQIFEVEVPEELSSPKHFTGSSEKVVSAYSPDLARLVRDAYARDFELLGYDTDHRMISPVRPPAPSGQYKFLLDRFRGHVEQGRNVSYILGKTVVTD